MAKINSTQASVSSIVQAKADERIRQMKTYRHLFEEIITDKNIELAIKEAYRSRKKSKKKRGKLEKLRVHEHRIEIVRKWITNYKCIKRDPREIYDGISRKKRYIFVPSVRENVVQHAVVQVLDKYLSKGTYEHCYAAIKGRGQHKAKKYVEKWVRKHPKDCRYYLKMDIKQYFPSVPQKILIEKLEHKVRDHRTIQLIKDILATSDEGIPLGYYISQWFANFYLQELDHTISEFPGKKMYIRWMDDMVIFSGNKRRLHRYKNDIEAELEKIGLRLKDNWRIERFDHKDGGCFLDFMGFRFYREKTTLRRSIFLRMCRKARRMHKKEKPTLFECRQALSYLGWIKDSDTYGAYLEYVKPFVNYQQIKRRISRHDRRENKECNTSE